MVKIKKGNLVATVTYSTFKNHYEKNGWKLRVNKNSNVNEENGEVITTNDVTNNEVNLDNMTVKEMKRYAKENGIDISEASSAQDLKTIIEAALAVDI